MRLIFTFLILILFGCNFTKKSNSNMFNFALTPVGQNGSLHIKNSNIVNSKGEIVSFAGNSLFWSNENYKGHFFYSKEVLEWLKDDWNSTIIRIPMAADPKVKDSYIFEPEDNESKVDIIVQAAIELGLYVIIDWHSHFAEENEVEAIEFFKKMAKKYGEFPNVLYEIYNEPLKVSWDDVIKPYSEKVIAAIRKIDPDNIIIVGTPNWSQRVDIVSENPITGFKNIAYTLHFYAGSHQDLLISRAKQAIDNGLPIVVTEWGTVNANGNGEIDHEYVDKWMKFMAANNLTHCNWSVHNKNEGASIFKPHTNSTGGWTEDDLTESGKLVRSYIKHWGK